jgi:hypothetical protein
MMLLFLHVDSNMCRIIDYMAKIGLWETVHDFELLAQKD